VDAFWLDNVLSGCAALSAVVLIYGAWLCVWDMLDPLREWFLRRLRAATSRALAKQKEG